MPLAIWRQPDLVAATVIGFCLFAAWIGSNIYLSLTLQRVLGYSPLHTALALIPLAVGGLIFATTAGRLLPLTGARVLLVTGLILYIAGVTLLALIDRDTAYWPHILTGVVLAVAGNSVTFVASNVLAMAHAPTDEQSLIGGLFNTAMQVGGVVGLAIMSVAATSRLHSGAHGAALLPGYHAAFWTAAVIGILGLAAAAVPLHAANPMTASAARRPLDTTG